MREPGGFHRYTTRVMSLVMVVIGVVLIVRTIASGGGPAAIGIVLGIAFLLVGIGRLYIGSRSR